MTHHIEISTFGNGDFAQWLRDRGHSVSISKTGETYVDGEIVRHSMNANRIFQTLWGEWFREAFPLPE